MALNFNLFEWKSFLMRIRISMLHLELMLSLLLQLQWSLQLLIFDSKAQRFFDFFTITKVDCAIYDYSIIVFSSSRAIFIALFTTIALLSIHVLICDAHLYCLYFLFLLGLTRHALNSVWSLCNVQINLNALFIIFYLIYLIFGLPIINPTILTHCHLTKFTFQDYLLIPRIFIFSQLFIVILPVPAANSFSIAQISLDKPRYLSTLFILSIFDFLARSNESIKFYLLKNL